MRKLHVRKLFLLTPLLLTFYESQAQGGLMTGVGVNVVASGNSSIVITDGNLDMQGTFAAGTGTVKFTGSSNATITGAGISFYNLSIDKTSNDLTLNNDITVDNNVELTSRHIQLNNNNIDLGTTGTLVGESNTSYITGLTGGTVIRTATLNAPTGSNPGNIGVEITSASDLGITQITRGHVQQQGVSSGIGIARYFDIVPEAGMNSGLNASVDFYYLDDELIGISEAELTMSAKSTPTGWWFLIGQDGLNVSSNVLTKDAIDTFGRITLTNELNNPLPITLISFSGHLQNRQTFLNWQVANEAGILSYDVEKSADGKSFKKFTTVAAKGQNQLQYNYDCVDPSPYKGNTYYRLKVYENNGRGSYSKIVKVNINDAVTVNVYPNPVSNSVNIEFNSPVDKTVSIKLLDVTGKLVSEKTVECSTGNNKITWDLSALAQATYYLQMEGDNSQIKLIKL